MLLFGALIGIMFFVLTVAIGLSVVQIWATRETEQTRRGGGSGPEPAAFDSEFLREVGIRSD